MLDQGFFASFVSPPCSADPVLIPTHTISRTTNSLDTITNRPTILTDRISQISQIFMHSCNITVSKLPSSWIKLQYWCPNEKFFLRNTILTANSQNIWLSNNLTLFQYTCTCPVLAEHKPLSLLQHNSSNYFFMSIARVYFQQLLLSAS